MAKVAPAAEGDVESQLRQLGNDNGGAPGVDVIAANPETPTEETLETIMTLVGIDPHKFRSGDNSDVREDFKQRIRTVFAEVFQLPEEEVRVFFTSWSADPVKAKVVIVSKRRLEEKLDSVADGLAKSTDFRKCGSFFSGFEESTRTIEVTVGEKIKESDHLSGVLFDKTTECRIGGVISRVTGKKQTLLPTPAGWLQLPPKPVGFDKPPSLVRSYWWIGALMLPVAIPLAWVSAILSLPWNLIFGLLVHVVRCTCVGVIVHVLLFPLLAIFLVFMILVMILLVTFLAYENALELASSGAMIPFQWCLLAFPWPHGNRTKVRAAGNCRCTGSVSRLTGLKDLESAEARASRAKSITMIERTKLFSGNEVYRYDLERYFTLEGGKPTASSADIDYPMSDGKTLLMLHSERFYEEEVEFSLSMGADPNIVMDEADDGTSSTALHCMVKDWSKSVEVEKFASIYKKLMECERTNPSIMGADGLTPYGWVQYGSPLLEIMAPKPSWAELESILPETAPDAPEELCTLIYDLVEKTWGSRRHWMLRIVDMLFCVHEGDEETLKARRILLFQRFLKPMMMQSVKGTMKKENVTLLLHIYEGMSGPPSRHCQFHLSSCPENCCRHGYKEEYDACLKSAADTLGNLYFDARVQMLAHDEAEHLFEHTPAKEVYIDDEELFHGRFTKIPAFVYSKDLQSAARELQKVGMMDSADCFCDLMQHGKHKKMKKPRKDLFRNSDGDEFWLALTMLWSIGVHHQLHAGFGEAMRRIEEQSRGAKLLFPPVKAFERSFEKAKEYVEEKSLDGSKGWNAPTTGALHVVDLLRCSFVVDSVAMNLRVGRLLEENFAIARKKNMHPRSKNGYADRKYNLIYQDLDSGRAVVCEVQLLMIRYIEIKEFGHLLYEFER